MSGWLIYWITRLDALEGLFFAMLLLGAIGTFASTVSYFVAKLDPAFSGKVDLQKTLLKIVIPVLIIGIFGSIFLPNTKEAAAIYLIPKIANNEDVQEIPANAAKLLNESLQKWMGEKLGMPIQGYYHIRLAPSDTTDSSKLTVQWYAPDTLNAKGGWR